METCIITLLYIYIRLLGLLKLSEQLCHDPLQLPTRKLQFILQCKIVIRAIAVAQH